MKFKFQFTNGTIEVEALNEAEAKILAKAEAIKRGWDYRIIVSRVSHIDIHVNWAKLSAEEEATLKRLLSKAQTNVMFEYEEEKSDG